MTLVRLRHCCLAVSSTLAKFTVNQSVAPIQGSPRVWSLPCLYLVRSEIGEQRRKQNVKQDFHAGECCDTRNSGGGCAEGCGPDFVERAAEGACRRSGPFAAGRNARE